MGRKGKLTYKVRDDFCAAIEIGAIYEVAAAYARISERTVYGWLKRGEDERERLEDDPEASPDENEARYLRFLHAVEEAKAVAAISWQQVIDNAAKRDPEWAWRMLQARYPEAYGKGGRSVNITSPDDGPQEIVLRWPDGSIADPP